jgi:hypothetical protein
VTTTKKLLGGVALALATVGAHAAPINGGFSLGGAAAPLGGASFSVATGIDFAPGAAASACTGDIATILGGASCSGATATTLNDFPAGTIPLGTGGAVAFALSPWIVLSAGGISFSISGITAYAHSDAFNSVSVAGTGSMSATGYDTTTGTFSISAQQQGNTFSFSSSQVSAGQNRVPEPGSMLLLGAGLLGLAAVRRRAAKA